MLQQTGEEASDECRTYWSALFITTPKKMEALSGTCLKIPCSFSVKEEKEFDNTTETFVIWYKEDEETYDPKNVVFNSSGTVNKFQMNITGNLRMKNCTTLIYNMKTTYEGVYYFRIENWPFMANARCDPLQIKVKDSPPSPKLIISGDLKEKESVTITCSASTPCPLSPPKLTWNLKQDSLNNMEENPDKTFTTKIQEQITLTDKHDGYNITCSATYPVNEGKEVKTAEETKTLRVSYSPKNTSASISPSGLVSAGIHVNLTCSSRANPPVSSFTWFKISRDGPMIVSEGEFYSFNATEGGVYYCVARNDLSNQTSPQIHLSVAENLISDLFGVDVHITLKILGIVLLCSSVIIFECWLKSRCFNKQVKVMGVTAVLSVNMVTAIMLLTVFSLSEASDDCRTYRSALFITTPKKMEALSGTCLKIPCSFSVKEESKFDNTTETFVIWYKEDKETYNLKNVFFNSSGTVNKFQMNITGNLRMKNCSTLIYNMKTTYEGVYYFRIENGPFRANARCDPLQITVKDSPPSPKLIISGDLKEKESVTITCSASTPCPLSPPKLTWTLKQDSLNNMEENPDKTFTTKIQEQITLTDKHDGYNITCSATYPVNEGKEVKTAEETQTLRVSYSPKNTSVSISPSGLVSAGIHVNLTCSSRANPPVSSFTWFKISRDGPMIVSEGEFYSFHATEGGVYYCVSMNDLGNQTSPQIHLSVAEKPVDAPLSPLWGSAFGIIVVVVCLAVCIWWLMRKHQTPQQNQSQGDGVLATYQPPNETEETIHYGEINFSVRGPEQLSVSVQDSGQQQDTLYAQVKVSKPASSRTQPADGPEDIYAQVRKK
nr:sialic acid-binding Ig-like lectin 7 isoform X2 [Labrus bergylta]